MQSSAEKTEGPEGQPKPGEALIKAGLPVISPGEVLLRYVSVKTGGVRSISLASGLSVQTLEGVLAGNQRVDAGIATKLAEFSDLTPGFWLNLQKAYDLHRKHR
jgi:addiction module HigA family antidote